MRHRLTTLALAAVTFGATALDETLRTGPIIAALGLLFVAALTWPSARLCELTLAATVGVSCLGPFGYALFATVIALGAMYLSESHAEGADTPFRLSAAWRPLPAVVILVGLVIAVGVGDRRNVPDPETSDPDRGAERTAATIEQIYPGRAQIDAERLALEAVSRADSQIQTDYILRDQADWGLQLTDSQTSNSGTDRLPWLLALLALVVGGYSLVASRRFGNTPITLASTTSSESTATPLDWYDRIVEAAGHERHQADPVLTHSRRLADDTGDERFRELGRIVSDHVYSGRALDDDDLELIRQLRRTET